MLINGQFTLCLRWGQRQVCLRRGFKKWSCVKNLCPCCLDVFLRDVGSGPVFRCTPCFPCLASPCTWSALAASPCGFAGCRYVEARVAITSPVIHGLLRIQDGAAVGAKSSARLWFGCNAVKSDETRRRSVDSTVGLSLVARQQSSDVLGGSLGLSLSRERVCVCARVCVCDRFMKTKDLKVDHTRCLQWTETWSSSKHQMNSPPPHFASNPAVPPSLPAHTHIQYSHTRSRSLFDLFFNTFLSSCFLLLSAFPSPFN